MEELWVAEAWSKQLTEAELRLLERVEKGMALTADVSRADVLMFVREGDLAVAVAQVKPHSIATLYRQSWIGQRRPLDEDPLIAAALTNGKRGQRQRNLLEQATPIIQQVWPVVVESGRVIGALQVETNLIAWERHKRRHTSFQRAVKWLQGMTLRGDLASADSLARFGEWDGVLFVDDSYHIRYLSGIANNLYRRLGYLDELQGQHIGDLQTKDELLVRQAFKTRTCQMHQVSEGARYWTRSVVPLWSYGSLSWPFGRQRQGQLTLRGALVMVHDETEKRRKAQELQVLSTMIREVHHRVKNNLQTVASILRMQSRRADDSDVQLQLSEAVNRVMAIAVIHEFLSQDDDQSINVRDVCQRIATQTQRAAIQPGRQIVLRTQGPPIYLPSQQATACALVANELLLNALEHGFGSREAGTVTMRLQDLGDEMALEVVDDGSGLPEHFDLERTDSLGLNIVRTLVEGDLKGQFSMERAFPGTRAVVQFRKDPYGGDETVFADPIG
jgi:two-component sensor histidine kinase